MRKNAKCDDWSSKFFYQMGKQWSLEQKWTTASFDLPPEGSAYKVNNVSPLQFKTKYVFVFKTIWLNFLLCTAL